jgi:hypothetical protein
MKTANGLTNSNKLRSIPFSFLNVKTKIALGHLKSQILSSSQGPPCFRRRLTPYPSRPESAKAPKLGSIGNLGKILNILINF